MKPNTTQLKIIVPIEVRDALAELARRDHRSMHMFLQVALAKIAEEAKK